MSSDTENLKLSGSTINSVLKEIESTLNTMKDNADLLNQNNQDIQSEISSAIVSLQFQDRVCQALSHVEENLAHLRSVFVELNELAAHDKTASKVNLEEIMSEIVSRYTTPDELARHNANSSSNDNKEAPAGLTFF